MIATKPDIPQQSASSSDNSRRALRLMKWLVLLVLLVLLLVALFLPDRSLAAPGANPPEDKILTIKPHIR